MPTDEKDAAAPQSAGGNGAVRNGGGLLLIGDDERLKGIERALVGMHCHARIRRVSGYLHALGEMAQSRPPGLLIGPVPVGNGEASVTAGALRELAPDAVLVALAQAGQTDEGAEAMACGFDDVIVPDDGETDLESIVRRALPAALPPREQVKADDVNGADDQVIAIEPALDPIAALARETGEEGLDSIPADGESEVDGAALGDVDLIARLLHDPEGLPELAAQLVAAQSDIPQVGVILDDTDVPDAHQAVAIRYGEHVFGKLHAPAPATAESLLPWASWLGHWLALHRGMTTLARYALHDDLTGLHNRRYFDRTLRRLLDQAKEKRFRMTLMLFDIDDFKRYNDKYGHPAGDEILRETARLMRTAMRKHDVVARVGGDEFAVIFWDHDSPRQPNSEHPHDVIKAAGRFREAVAAHRFPKLLDEAPGTLTISGGLASFPWDGRSAEELYQLADDMLLQSKRQGKNAITFGPGAKNGEPQQQE